MYEFRVSKIVITFMPNFVKIGQLVQTLKEGLRTDSMAISYRTPSTSSSGPSNAVLEFIVVCILTNMS